ncbi:putative dinucleotide-binding enzyme [Flavobacterium sp. HSC-32F16]|uniref:NAD(P)-binding domain-containing protein n=1 Tax=Flavobacterium sp. HSC-32F16 TaxID=2910964 RepID=UPI0020A2E37A|nr:NAD(P)-binding domain-containing protein [Flavobacterium sp. HSC-32F16]MCP2029703.1 putative dinucleotide-binding enzyme [Flavobacterium sp. HSC-32F16]
MSIGIIGIGSFTLEIARRAYQAGYDVIIHNPRGNSLIRDVTEKIGPEIKLVSLGEAAQAEIILLFIPKDELKKVIDNLPDMTGKIIVHTSTLIFDPQSLFSGIKNAMTYKITASLLPNAHIIKLFSPIDLNKKSDDSHNKKREEIFFIADHADSKYTILLFLKKLLYTPIDLSGRLKLQNIGIDLGSVLNSITTNK